VENVRSLSKSLLMTLGRPGETLGATSAMLDELTAEKTLPQNLEAERSVLGAILLDPASVSLVVPIVKPDDFFPDAHRRIFGAMMELSERSAEIDVLTLKEELDRNGAVEKIGGASYLTSLLDHVPDVGNVEHYARIVKEKSTLRRLIRTGQRIMRDGLAGTKDAEVLLGEATGEIFEIAEGAIQKGFEPIGDVVSRNLEIIEDARGRQGMLSGLATGFTELDRMTSGLQNTDLIIVAARPSVGKTSFALNIASTSRSAKAAPSASSRSRCRRSSSDSASCARRPTWMRRRSATATPPRRPCSASCSRSPRSTARGSTSTTARR